MRPDVGGPLSSDTLFVYPTALKADDVARVRRRGAAAVSSAIGSRPSRSWWTRWRGTSGVGTRVLEPHLAAVVLARALERSGTSGALRAPGAGLLRELLSFIEELEAACLGPGDVAALATGLGDPAAAARIADVAHAYQSYVDELARLGAVDRRGRERAVWERLVAVEAAGRRPAPLAGVRRIVFAELYDFSALQFLVATSLIRLIGDAELIAFAHPENVDATRFVERTWNRFVADASISEQVLPSFVARGGRHGNLAAVLRGVFAGAAPEPVPPDGSIRMVAAPGRYAEVETAVRDIRRRLERGEPAERIAHHRAQPRRLRRADRGRVPALSRARVLPEGTAAPGERRRRRVARPAPLRDRGVPAGATRGDTRERLLPGARRIARPDARAHRLRLRARAAPGGVPGSTRTPACESRAATKTGPERAAVEAQRARLARRGRRLEEVVAALRPLDGRRSFVGARAGC